LNTPEHIDVTITIDDLHKMIKEGKEYNEMLNLITTKIKNKEDKNNSKEYVLYILELYMVLVISGNNLKEFLNTVLNIDDDSLKILHLFINKTEKPYIKPNLNYIG